MNEPMFSLDDWPQAQSRIFAIPKQAPAIVTNPPGIRAKLLAGVRAFRPAGLRRLAPGGTTSV
jgi:hypothetical protein